MNETLLNYISENYEKIIKQTIGGEYIEIDLIPNGDDNRLYTLIELIDSCDKTGIDVYMFIRSGYESEVGDGIRMGRYWYFMQKTTKKILNDLNSLKVNTKSFLGNIEII